TGGIVPRLATRAQFWDGREVELEISNSFMELPDQGKVLLSIFRDVSERKDLEHQLRQAQKMEAIGQLAGGVAHDFNNLLLVIRGNAELMLMDTGVHNSETLDCLKQIEAAAERAGNLTRQLLAFSRKQVLQPQPVGLDEVISNLAKMLHRIIGEHIQMQCELGSKPHLIHADAGMMEQVLVNLVVNARDAMPKGGQLRIETQKVSVSKEDGLVHPEARPGEFVCLTVADTGDGIAPENINRVFEPFFTTKAPGQGTGLGLAMVYGIVKQHGGWIEVESQVGRGTQVRVFVPQMAAAAGRTESPGATAEVPGGTEAVLLVEDDEAVREVTRRVLESAGYQVHCARNGSQAWEIWLQQRDKISLLLTDMVLPDGKNGRELVSELREQKPGLHAIFISGYNLGVPQDVLRETGAVTRFLQKPCPCSALLRTVRECLDGASVPAAKTS
ncbi:MAG TPA: ATP-binding protein, partial [Clostridia bacterium]|nr:ATP-binding protein [Clostridia bacterium]